MLASILLAALALQTPDTARILLVATTDVHGYVTEWDYLKQAPYPGGLVRAATIIDSLRARYPDQVVLVDAGDLIEGSPFASFFATVAPRDPHPVIDAMNGMGYDAATPGNHEFDYGLPLMNRALSAANFRYVSGNIRVPPRDTLAFEPYTIVQRQGVRIGITGFTTPGVMVWDADQVRGRLRVERIESSAAGVLRELRRDADLAIALVHAGLDGPSAYDTAGTGGEHRAAALSTGPWKPDLVVVGHSHRELVDSVINGVHFVQPKPLAQGLSITHIDLVRNGAHWTPVRFRGELISLAAVRPSPKMQRRLVETNNLVLGWVTQPIGEATAPMRAAAARAEATPIANFINEVQRAAARADLSATPIYEPRAGFESGEITVGQVLALYPHDNTLKAVRIGGDQLRAYLEQSARYFYADSTGRVGVNALVAGYNYDIVGGASYAIDLSRPPGDRIRDLTVRGRPVLARDTFTLALSDYRQTGTGGYDMVKDAPVVYQGKVLIRDLLIEAIRRKRMIGPEEYSHEGWRIVPADAARLVRAFFVKDLPQARATAPSRDTVLQMIVVRPDSVGRQTALARAQADSIAGATVATLRLPATGRSPGSGLGRLVADAYRNALRADLAIVATDELARDLPAGALTAAMIAAAVPGDHRLLKLTMKGEELQWVFEHLVEEAAPCCHLAGAVMTYAPDKPQYKRVKEVRLANGRKLDRKGIYTLAISDRLVTESGTFVLGASRCIAGLGCVQNGMVGQWLTERSPQSGHDALEEYLRRLPQPVTIPEDARLVSSK